MHSPLHDVHIGLGAHFTEFAGWSMPLRYASELAEHRAVRAAAGLFDLSHMGEILVRGPESGLALDRALVGHLSALRVGRARYTMLCHDTGGVLDDLVVYRLADDEFLVVANAANTVVVALELRDRVHGYQARITDRTADYALVAVQGPASAPIVAEVTDADLDALTYYACAPATVSGPDGTRFPALLARTGYTGEDGFELYVTPAAAPGVWAALTAAGRPHGLVPAGLAARDTLRLEAGMPLHGNELTVHTTPFDAGLGRVVRLDKPGGFVGRAALAKRRASGGDTTLVGLRGQGRRAMRTGDRVLRGTAVVGEVTSGALSPTLGCPVAMAYVDPSVCAPGTRLAVDVRGALTDAEVVPLPFYRR